MNNNNCSAQRQTLLSSIHNRFLILPFLFGIFNSAARFKLRQGLRSKIRTSCNWGLSLRQRFRNNSVLGRYVVWNWIRRSLGLLIEFAQSRMGLSDDIRCEINKLIIRENEHLQRR